MKNFLYALVITSVSLSGAMITSTPVQAQNDSQSNSLSLEAPSVTPLKADDRLRLTVAGFPDLSAEHVVMADGTIQLPMVGSIYLRGLTPAQATAKLTEALRPYVRRPQVSLSLLNPSPIRVSITGEVLHPGPRILSANSQTSNTDGVQTKSNFNLPTLSDALMLAGGITPSADLQKVIIRRLVPSNSISDAPVQVARTEITVNLWQVIQSGNLEADPRIQDGDEIVVPIAQVSRTDQRMLLASTLAPSQIRVQVAGEVRNPGQIQVSPMAGVSDAVAAAGGLTDKARRKSIALLRFSPTGQLERQTFKFGETSTALKNGDLIIVEKSRSDGILDFIGKILPVNSLLNLFR